MSGTTTTTTTTTTTATTNYNNVNNNNNNNNNNYNNCNNNNNNNNNDLSVSKFVNIAVSDDDLTEDEMLAQALQMSLQESNPPTPKPAASTKPDTLSARFEQLQISPEDPLDAIGVTPNDVTRLAQLNIRTVRQLVEADKAVMAELSKENEGLIEAWQFAMRLGERFKPSSAPAAAPVPAPASSAASANAPASTSARVEDDDTAVWGYHYLAESVYEQIKEDRTIKSAYVLFHEYMECPVQLRNLHPWKRVYHAYLSDAAKWNGARGKHKVENLTDTGMAAVIGNQTDDYLGGTTPCAAREIPGSI
eukprot:Phypoly_transcript_05545.p1 GENE.Phypoly_transcript_05545~~Phypoly_transcript_05545.p1  ORF type:complete len:306 (+),score=78.84 Phypoly_transcript_05545:126-1043(+)